MDIHKPELKTLDNYISGLENKKCFFDNCENKIISTLTYQGEAIYSNIFFKKRSIFSEQTQLNYIFACKEHHFTLSLLGIMMLIHGGTNKNMINGIQQLKLEDAYNLKDYYIFCGLIKKFLEVDTNDDKQVNNLMFNFHFIIKDVFNIRIKMHDTLIIKKMKDEFKFFIFPLPFDKTLLNICNIAQLFEKFIYQLIQK
jgi:hypothetical protein